MYCYVWEYDVRPDRLSAFEENYSPGGGWTKLFGRDPEYVRTELLRDRDLPERYLTLDFWTSRDACMAFREQFGAEFHAFDEQCAALTTAERFVGEFDLAS